MEWLHLNETIKVFPLWSHFSLAEMESVAGVSLASQQMRLY